MYIHYMLAPNSNLASSLHGSVFVLVHVEPFYQGSVVALSSNLTGVFTLADTDTGTDTDTDTDKMGLQPICICVGACVGQCEHLHTILFNPFFLSVSVSGSVNTPYRS